MKSLKSGMRAERVRLELRMELNGQEPGMVRNLGDFVEPVLGEAGELHSPRLHELRVASLEFVPVPVPFADPGSAVGAGGERTLPQNAGHRAHPHGAAHRFHAFEIAQQLEDLVFGMRVEFLGARPGESAFGAREFDHRPLESVADAEERHAIDACPSSCLRHPFGSTRSEAAGHQDAVAVVELREIAILEALGFHPADLDARVMGHSAVHKGLG